MVASNRFYSLTVDSFMDVLEKDSSSSEPVSSISSGRYECIFDSPNTGITTNNTGAFGNFVFHVSDGQYRLMVNKKEIPINPSVSYNEGDDVTVLVSDTELRVLVNGDTIVSTTVSYDPMNHSYDRFLVDANTEDMDDSWTTVTYKKPPKIKKADVDEVKEYDLRKKREIIRKDAKLSYLKEAQELQHCHTLRLLKNQCALKRLGIPSNYSTVKAYVSQNWNHSARPIVMQKKREILDEDGNPVDEKQTYAQALVDKYYQTIEKNVEEGNLKQKKFSQEYIKKVISKRMELGMSQSKLAIKISRRRKVIEDFEKGELIYERSLVSLLNWALELN